MNRKVVLITGGSSGIGNSIGCYLVQKGYVVYGTTRNVHKYPDFKDFNLLQLDVRDTESITNAFRKVIEKEGSIDVVINNAGVGITGAIEETPTEEILNAFSTNFNGPINVIKGVLPYMREQNSGLIINITSIAGYMGLPYRGIYSATKGALNIVTETLRMETKDFGVQITSLAPGDFATNIAAGRYHSPILENSPYKKPYSQTLEAIDADVDSGGDPIMVAKAVLKIINTPKPRVHYKVGSFLQKFSIKLKKLLPSKVYEKILLRHSKL
ncbi:short-subunit dehydrogenase [Maribacter vaceletii]|uniref:Short-subunit dehydrogenase n=1 Tax=Maribacter vaceletii TaxID=1206816 RepID=A0A495EBT5_9FLAO|nr:SDR family oxidoreductase [Maribacter vaceletii]RKR13357.1 short-subunit dehydrogenase [Maribacter vaceletii]